MWTPQFIGIAVGCFLMIVAIMGGGVEVKEIKIPRLSGWARFGSALLGAGIALASSGSGLVDTQAAAYSPPANLVAEAETGNQAGTTAPEPEPAAETRNVTAEAQPPAPPPPPAGYITIIDKLADGQEYERIVVYLNGEAAGRLAVDQSERVDRLRIPADDSVVRYHLEGRERGFESAGVITHRLEGQGTIRLKAGAVYEASLAAEQLDPDDDVLQIDLAEAVATPADQGSGEAGE